MDPDYDGEQEELPWDFGGAKTSSQMDIPFYVTRLSSFCIYSLQAQF